MKGGGGNRGFSLIELMVTISVIAVLMILAGPTFSNSVANARERSVVQKFSQDFDWARGSAGTNSVTLMLNADCSWAASVNGAVDAAHSMTAATLLAQTPGIACSGGTLALPVTFSFSAQGFTSPSGSLSFTGAKGQQWPLQVLYSGSIVRVKGAS